MLQNASYARLWADDQGESHFEDIEVELVSIDYAPPAPPLWFGKVSEATSIGYLVGETGWGGNVPHPSPRRQLICVLGGRIEITASEGEIRSFSAGDCVLLDDLSGKGHITRALEEALCLAVALN